MSKSALSVDVLASGKTDNFFFLLHARQHGLLIDPVDAPQAIERVKALGLDHVDLFNTHWHPDHTQGNAQVLKAFPEAKHFGPRAEADLIATHGGSRPDGLLKGDDEVEVGGYRLRVLEVPGHTHGHIALLDEAHFLSGDVIFRAGAGHCHSGDPGVFAKTYRQVVASLPGELVYYPGHDYSRKNLEFARSVEPDSEAIAQALKALKESEDSGASRSLTLYTLAQERQVNPFMRAHLLSLQRQVEEHHGEAWASAQERLGPDASPHDVTFCALRTLRNQW